MALVVFVFASILMLAQGLERTLVETGSYDNALLLRKGSTSEVLSFVPRDQASILETLPEIATGSNGERLFAKEVVVLVAIPKRGSNKPSNVVFRGIERLPPPERTGEADTGPAPHGDRSHGRDRGENSGMALNESLCCGMKTGDRRCL
jgi:hypothetical protein